MRSPALPGGTGTTTLMTPVWAGEVGGLHMSAARAIPTASQRDGRRAIVRLRDLRLSVRLRDLRLSLHPATQNLKYIIEGNGITFSYEAGFPPARLRRLCPAQVFFGRGGRVAHQPARCVEAHRRSGAGGWRQAH